MHLGIFTKIFVRPTLEGALDAVAAHGLRWMQFNFACAGLPNLPDEEIAPALLSNLRQQLDARGLSMAAVSGTFNMAHPDPQQRGEGLRRLPFLAAACRELEVPVITLCPGTRDPQDMWRHHPENSSPEAWRDLTETLSEALTVAAQFGVTLAFEPEVSNVVDSARQGRRLLDEMQSPHLKVVMDAANLFASGKLPRMREVLNEAFQLLGADIVLAHAKDLDRDGEAGHQAAGTGLLDYDYYLRLLHQSGFRGALLLHSLAESQVDQSVRFVREKLARLEGSSIRSR